MSDESSEISNAQKAEQKKLLKKCVTQNESSMSNIMQELKPVEEASDESCGFFKMTKIETNGSTNNETNYNRPAALASFTNEESKKLDEKSNFGDSVISEIAGVVSSNDTGNFTALAKLESFGSSYDTAGSRK